VGYILGVVNKNIWPYALTPTALHPMSM
jgi:hypothetical protein